MTEHFTHAGGYSHRSRRHADESIPQAKDAGVFVPMLLLALAVVGGIGVQTLLLARENQQLALARTGLQAQEQVAVKLRAALDALATSTAKLAADGNVNARKVVDDLRSRGITIDPKGTTKPPR